MESNNTRILFVGLYKEANLGDEILSYCTERLFGKYYETPVTPSYAYLDYIEKTYKPSIPRRIVNKLQVVLFGRAFLFNYDKVIAKKRKYYFRTVLKDVDMAVVVGGGIIKFRVQYFYHGLHALFEGCEFYHIPTVLNAVGVEDYDEKDKKCIALKELIHSQALKYISTRDDYDTLTHKYFEDNAIIPLRKVCDPAVWASEIYNISRQNSNVVGIGVIRENIFEDYGKPFSSSAYIELMVVLVSELINKGVKVKLFTNGWSEDGATAYKIQKGLSLQNIDVEVTLPLDAKNLITIISGFKAVVASRLHACIISYSLNIPIVGLVWNDKVKGFGYNIESPDDFLEVEKLNVRSIIDRLFIALEKGQNTNRLFFRNTIINEIKKLKSELCNNKSKR